MKANDSNVILSVAQIVEVFGVSMSAVRKWIAAGKLAPVTREHDGKGGRMFFTRGAVLALRHFGKIRANFRRFVGHRVFCLHKRVAAGFTQASQFVSAYLQ